MSAAVHPLNWENYALVGVITAAPAVLPKLADIGAAGTVWAVWAVDHTDF